MTFKKSYGINYYIDNGLCAAVLLMADDELIRHMVFAQCCFILDKNEQLTLPLTYTNDKHCNI